MKVSSLNIADVLVIEPDVFGDERGFFMETYESRKYAQIGVDHLFVQDNHSRSTKNTLRGLHYQIKQPQGKLVRVVKGSVFDVAVDMRRSSPTFGCWVGTTLSAANHRQLWVPPGFAHGFFVLSDVADFVYKCTDYYAPEHERSLLWDDPHVAVEWPIENGVSPLLSDKDLAGKSFAEAEAFV